jgi:hypothetical protein
MTQVEILKIDENVQVVILSCTRFFVWFTMGVQYTIGYLSFPFPSVKSIHTQVDNW